ncbi:hypothetical protein OE88DRAFT_1668127 [Heliocybe sulcata]|uniref:Uncharacterized protein n=1 Tax=Heliocybe sulcata TaxID=5364 RepID=A0A5C3MLM4_9AGAM|nr:hypothetical protein OE88DRAFT_1668127 [Heliocybe sulcata]
MPSSSTDINGPYGNIHRYPSIRTDQFDLSSGTGYALVMSTLLLLSSSLSSSSTIAALRGHQRQNASNRYTHYPTVALLPISDILAKITAPVGSEVELSGRRWLKISSRHRFLCTNATALLQTERKARTYYK